MHFVLSAIIALLALLDLMLGVGFLVNPAASGADFGLSAGAAAEGLSAMRADFTAFFLVAAGFMAVGAWRRRGDVLTVPRMGDADSVTGRYGDLVCSVTVIDDPPRAERVRATASQPNEASTADSPPPPPADPGPDMRASADTRIVAISFVEAILGSRIEVETGKGKVRVTVPPGSSSGTRMRLSGRGRNGGDLYVVLKVIVPRNLDEESRELIERFAELHPMDPRTADD